MPKQTKTIRRSAISQTGSIRRTRALPAHHARRVIRSKRSPLQNLLLHPSSLFAILIVGVCLAGLSYKAVADDYSVTATVAAAPLTRGATITSPANNATVSTRPIVVTGTCPNDAYVKLSRNGIFSGSAICNQGAFSITTDLFDGANDLQAQDYTITNDAGPVTGIVHVIYQAATGAVAGPSLSQPANGTHSASPQPVSQSSPTSTTKPEALPPLLLHTDYQFNVATTAEDFHWQLQYQYAAPPVDTNINWGDGSKTSMIVPGTAPFTISHHYKSSGYYPVIIEATDANKQTVTMQLVALIKKPADGPIRGSIIPSGSNRGTGSAQKPTIISRLHWLLYAWPTYLILAVMVVSFWLGERREFIVLTRSDKKPRARLRHT